MVSEELPVQALAEERPPSLTWEPLNRYVEAHQGKEGAEEEAGIRMAL